MTAALDDLDAAASAPTPVRLFRPAVARRRLESVASLRDAVSRPPVSVLTAYSVKTNPRSELLALAHAAGFLAETISADERDWTARNGFARSATIANGPEPVEAVAGEPLAYAFADSLEAYERNVRRAVARVHGVRLRPAMIASRFGVPVDDDAELQRMLSRSAAGAPIAISFHVGREDFNGAGWRDVASDVLERAETLERLAGVRITAFDVAGGWTPEEFDATFAADIRWLGERLAAALPSCTRLIAEPGQAVCTPSEALACTVLEVRGRGGRREAIVDAGYPEWPQMHAYVHGLYVRREDGWQPLGRGADRLGGRTGLEYDLVDGLRFPDDLAPGDRLLITDTGSYDRTRSFGFAPGG